MQNIKRESEQDLLNEQISNMRGIKDSRVLSEFGLNGCMERGNIG